MGSQTLLIAAGIAAAVVVLALVARIARRRRDYVFLHTPIEERRDRVPEILLAKGELASTDKPVAPEAAAPWRAEVETYAEAACAPAVVAEEVASPVEPLVADATDSLKAAETEVNSYVMETPVELWLGDVRVGVRPNTHTHRQFMKYADILLRDLKATKADAR